MQSLAEGLAMKGIVIDPKDDNLRAAIYFAFHTFLKLLTLTMPTEVAMLLLNEVSKHELRRIVKGEKTIEE